MDDKSLVSYNRQLHEVLFLFTIFHPSNLLDGRTTHAVETLPIQFLFFLSSPAPLIRDLFLIP